MNIEDLQNYLSKYSKIIFAYKTDNLEEEKLSEPKQILDYKQLESFYWFLDKNESHGRGNVF